VTPLLGATPLPAWRPEPDVWLVIGTLGVAYLLAVVRLGPRYAPGPGPAVTRFQVVAFSLGLFTLWLVSDWPVHELGEEYIYSAHMVQHLVFALVGVPMMLAGTPAWMLRLLLAPPRLFRAVRWMSRMLPALVLYNLVLVLTHWPAVVDLTLRNGFAHFLAHTVLVVSSVIVWMPVLSPLPEIPRLFPPMRMVYLFLQSVVPTVPASFLTFGTKPLYPRYELMPKLFGWSVLDDQLVAGLMMKIGAGILLWTVISVIFFRWASEESADAVPRHDLREIDRELTEMGMTTS